MLCRASFLWGWGMETVKLFCAGQETGEITLRRDGRCTEIRASMPDPGDGVYRAALIGEQGRMALGVMEPAGDGLALCRRPYSRDVVRLGPLLRGEASRSVAFWGQSGWRETMCPARLFQSEFIISRLPENGRAWWRREGEVLYLALPLEKGGPFPMEALFCLGRIQCVEGRCCVVYAFDKEEQPVFQEK